MKDYFQRFIKVLKEDDTTPESLASQKATIRLFCMAMTLICIGLALMNFHRGFPFIALANLGVGAVLYVCALLSKYDKSIKYFEGCSLVVIIVLFSMYLLASNNGGVGTYWMIIMPILFAELFGLRSCLLIGGVFQLELILLFWTPLQKKMEGQYSEQVLLIFPVFFFFAFLLAVILGYKEKQYRLADKKKDAMMEQAILEERRRVERVSIDAIMSVTHALDAKDPYTRRHSEHVAFYATCIAEALGMTPEQVEEIGRAGQLHDLGKIGIPDAILNKEAKLTDEEYARMKTHVDIGADIISEFSTMPELVTGAKYHHERYDGLGYGNGLKGEEIPLTGRIICVADTIDAMYTKRVYREKLDKQVVIDEIKACSGKQFDPELADLAVRLIQEGMLEHMEEDFGEA